MIDTSELSVITCTSVVKAVFGINIVVFILGTISLPHSTKKPITVELLSQYHDTVCTHKCYITTLINQLTYMYMYCKIANATLQYTVALLYPSLTTCVIYLINCSPGDTGTHMTSGVGRNFR